MCQVDTFYSPGMSGNIRYLQAPRFHGVNSWDTNCHHLLLGLVDSVFT